MSYEIRMILFFGIFLVGGMCLFELLVDFILHNYRGEIVRIVMSLIVDEPLDYLFSDNEYIQQVINEPLN